MVNLKTCELVQCGKMQQQKYLCEKPSVFQYYAVTFTQHMSHNDQTIGYQ